MGYKLKSWRGNSKYHSKKTEVDGIRFDSRKEAVRYAELKMMEKQGIIQDLQLQKRFELIPEFREPDISGPRGGIKKGRVIQQPVYYYADFTYKVGDDLVVEDVKGFRTEVYKIKKKLMYARYKIKIVEI